MFVSSAPPRGDRPILQFFVGSDNQFVHRRGDRPDKYDGMVRLPLPAPLTRRWTRDVEVDRGGRRGPPHARRSTEVLQVVEDTVAGSFAHAGIDRCRPFGSWSRRGAPLPARRSTEATVRGAVCLLPPPPQWRLPVLKLVEPDQVLLPPRARRSTCHRRVERGGGVRLRLAEITRRVPSGRALRPSSSACAEIDHLTSRGAGGPVRVCSADAEIHPSATSETVRNTRSSADAEIARCS